MKALLVGLMLAGATQQVAPVPQDGFTITDPMDPTATVIGTPDGQGGYTLVKPFDPEGLRRVIPDGAGGYTITNPYGGDD